MLLLLHNFVGKVVVSFANYLNIQKTITTNNNKKKQEQKNSQNSKNSSISRKKKKPNSFIHKNHSHYC